VVCLAYEQQARSDLQRVNNEGRSERIEEEWADVSKLDRKGKTKGETAEGGIMSDQLHGSDPARMNVELVLVVLKRLT
jgi:hypothetical protein